MADKIRMPRRRPGGVERRRRKQDNRWKELELDNGEVWHWRFRRDRISVRTPDNRIFLVPLCEVTGDWDEENEKRLNRSTGWTGIETHRIRSYVENHLATSEHLELPPFVFLHRHRTVERYPGAASRWHMFRDCRFLARYRGEADFAERIDPHHAEEILGRPLTRRNLCGVCMRYMTRRDHERQGHG